MFNVSEAGIVYDMADCVANLTTKRVIDCTFNNMVTYGDILFYFDCLGCSYSITESTFDHIYSYYSNSYITQAVINVVEADAITISSNTFTNFINYQNN